MKFIKRNLILIAILCLIPVFGFSAARTLKTVLNEDTMEDATFSGNIHVAGHMCYYGEMAIIDNANALTINAADEWHAIDGDIVTGLVHGFTYAAGSDGVIASTTDAGSGDVTINDVAHGLSAGDYITINGTTNYNGIFEVKTAATDSFTITDTWVSDQSGYWQQGASLTCDVGSAGTYRGMWNACGISSTTGHVFDFSPCINTTVSGKAKSRRKFSNTDYGSFGGGGLMVFAEGDVIQFLIQNIGNSGNITIRTFDINIVKI